MEANRPKPYESIRLDNQLCFPLYACAKEIVRQYRTPLEPLGLTYTQYVVMMVLWNAAVSRKRNLVNGCIWIQVLLPRCSSGWKNRAW